MSDTETPAQKPEKSAPLFSQANITTGLAVLAVILAAAPYVVPQVQTQLVRNGLMAKPAVLEDAMQKLSADREAEANQSTQAAIAAHHDSIFNDKGDPTLGTGPIKVVEFLDYNCAYCRRGEPVIKAFLAENPDVTLVVKEYPVVHPPESIVLAKYALAAYQNGKYADIHDVLLTDDQNLSDLKAISARAGLDLAKVSADAGSPATAEQIKKTVTLGTNLGISGTPTFIVGDTVVAGADPEKLRAAVDAERKRLKKG
ncbi:DsbA family protein [Asticcacaulis solisilvae]|uniref:DsbA family protein n=1 Tax=Asticcacaulis solisilvae TaxID=1217274 RepID=UPI003FD76B64